jgi:hypothetical protein
LATISKAGFLRDARLPINDGNLMPGFLQKPGRGRAYDAGTEHNHFHSGSCEEYDAFEAALIMTIRCAKCCLL